MKHISSKLILLTILLVASLIAINAFLSIQILKKESRAYTFQAEQLQTQSFAKHFELELSRAQEVAARVFSLRISENKLPAAIESISKDVVHPNSSIEGIAVFGKQGLKNKWYGAYGETIEKEIKRDDEWLQKMKSVNLVHGAAATDEIVFFPSENAIVAVKMNFEKMRNECSGLPVGFYNQNGIALFFCNAEIEKRITALPESLKTALSSTFQSGSFEKRENDFGGLWAYSSIGAWGKVVSVIDTETAFRPAFILGIQIALLALFSIGLAILASMMVARKVTGPITVVSEATKKIANGEFGTPILVHTQDETRALADSVQGMAQKIKKLIQSEIEKTKIEDQLQLAGALQRLFIPKSEIDFENYHVSSLYLPADQCGGDWWGYVRSEKKLVLFIGDVTGHGYASAMLVATTRGYLSMLQNDINQAGEIKLNPVQFLKILNHVIYESMGSELNMTALCLILDQETGKFQISSAGHNPLYIMNETTKEVHSFGTSGSRLGATPEIEAGMLDILEGEFTPHTDRLVLFTDGIQELGVGQKLLNRKGFKAFLQKHVGKTGSELVKLVQDELIPLNQGAHLQDDITFLVLESKNG